MKSVRFWYNWVPVIVTVFNTWVLIALLFLYTYARKRRTTSLALQRMAEEEKFLYGDLDENENGDDSEDKPPTTHYLH